VDRAKTGEGHDNAGDITLDYGGDVIQCVGHTASVPGAGR
jgi:hypothetical protein